ncbi:putative disease resistance protein RGA1 [Cornus florida]|uniref:putative disease resistance protein RGA1 n=1 Tax=Cornus florida TaxID=4283 RepID=UPI00289E21B5|nr:putative disease resistance protein RGA1 [Cornus florida]
MAADHLQFLKEKFITDFQDAMEQFGVELPLRRHFQEILEVLQEKIIDSATPIKMKNSLYDLRYFLAECLLSAEKERDLKNQNTKSNFHVHTVKKLWFLYKTGKKLHKIKKELQQMSNESDAEAENSLLLLDSISVGSVADLPPLSASKIYGLDRYLQKVESLLLKTPDDPILNGIKAVGIVGMCGVGKSALAHMVVHSFPVQQTFSPIIWVRLSAGANPREMVRDLLMQSAPKHEFVHDDALPVLLRKLNAQLSSRKYLIVLDHVWHQDEWYSDLSSDPKYMDGAATCFTRLTHGLPKGGGGAIIVTSRLDEVATSMVGEHKPGHTLLIRLEPSIFNEEALGSTFMDSILRKKFEGSDHYQTVLRMKKEIVDRCDGLPAAAKTLAEVIYIQAGQNGLRVLSTSDQPKKVSLRLHNHDCISYRDALKKVKTLPGVDRAVAGPYYDEITASGKFNAVEVARELGKFWHTELISVDREQEAE